MTIMVPTSAYYLPHPEQVAKLDMLGFGSEGKSFIAVSAPHDERVRASVSAVANDVEMCTGKYVIKDGPRRGEIVRISISGSELLHRIDGAFYLVNSSRKMRRYETSLELQGHLEKRNVPYACALGLGIYYIGFSFINTAPVFVPVCFDGAAIEEEAIKLKVDGQPETHVWNR